MRIKFFTKDFADLEMSIVEIDALKNASIEARKCEPSRKYMGTTDTTHQEADGLQKKLDRLAETFAPDSEYRFGERELIAMHTSLNVVFDRLDGLKFDALIGIDKSHAETIISLLGDLIYEKMLPTVSAKIFATRKERITKGISFLNVEIPRPVQIRQECALELERTALLFLLFSLKNVKTFSGIKIVLLRENIVRTQSVVQNINFFDLADMAAYLLVHVDALKEKESLEDEQYIFSANNYNHEKLFELKVISGFLSSDDRGMLELFFKMYVPTRDEIDLPLEFQEKVSFNHIYNFAASIREYLKQIGSSSQQTNKTKIL